MTQPRDSEARVQVFGKAACDRSSLKAPSPAKSAFLVSTCGAQEVCDSSEWIQISSNHH